MLINHGLRGIPWRVEEINNFRSLCCSKGIFSATHHEIRYSHGNCILVTAHNKLKPWNKNIVIKIMEIIDNLLLSSSRTKGTLQWSSDCGQLVKWKLFLSSHNLDAGHETLSLATVRIFISESVHSSRIVLHQKSIVLVGLSEHAPLCSLNSMVGESPNYLNAKEIVRKRNYSFFFLRIVFPTTQRNFDIRNSAFCE